MGIKSFNFCSVKVYHSYINDKGEKINKATSWHADTLYKADGTVGTNSSLQPNTPVAILSVGDEKIVWFRRHVNGKKIIPHSLIYIPQQSCSMIVLDPRDEVPDENGYKWYHSSTMTETGKCTFSFMCCFVTKLSVLMPKHTESLCHS